jgi:hypothetical protein
VQGAAAASDAARSRKREVAFLATATEGQTVEDASAVARVALTFDSLRTEALHSRASRELIMMTAENQWTT